MLALRDGKSRSEAYEYAEGRFNDRFKDFENGQLTIYFRFESKNIKGDQLHHNDIQDIIAYAKSKKPDELKKFCLNNQIKATIKLKY